MNFRHDPHEPLLTWPECARLCKKTLPAPYTSVSFVWGQSDHVFRRFFQTEALPNLRRLCIEDPTWGGGPGELFLGLAERGRALEEMIVTTYLNLARTRCVKFTVRYDDHGEPVTYYEFPCEPLYKGELDMALDGLGLPRPALPIDARFGPPHKDRPPSMNVARDGWLTSPELSEREAMEDRRFADRLRRATERWSGVNPQELQQLERLVRRLPLDQQFDMLAQPFEEPPENAFLAQEYAGRLLTKLKPPCRHELSTVLRRLLPKWNRSVEQLPWYLAGVFGRDAVARSVDAVEGTGGVEPELADTVRYWLRGLESERGPG